MGRIVFLSFNLQHIPNISERACYYILMLWCGLTFRMTNRLDQRRLDVAKWDSRGWSSIMSTESCIKVFLNIMITCTNAF